MHQGPPRRRRARPVADAPIDALLSRAEDLAKGWLLTLLEQAPLDDAPGILAADLAREGPGVCATVVRALANDDDLRRIEPGGELELFVAQAGEFAGSRGPEATSRAIDALSAVIWSAVRGELSDPDAWQIAELAERLALVIELVRVAALRYAAPVGSAAPAAGQEAPRESAPALFAVAGAAEQDQPPDPLWIGALEDEIVSSERSGSPLSLLLVELEDADRIVAADAPAQAAASFGRFAQAVRSVVRRQDILACESVSRAWIIARDTGRFGAQRLGARAVAAARAAQSWRAAPLSVHVGLAVLGEDGRDSAALIDAAEEAKFVAEAGGVGVAERSVPADDEQP